MSIRVLVAVVAVRIRWCWESTSACLASTKAGLRRASGGSSGGLPTPMGSTFGAAAGAGCVRSRYHRALFRSASRAVRTAGTFTGRHAAARCQDDNVDHSYNAVAGRISHLVPRLRAGETWRQGRRGREAQGSNRGLRREGLLHR